MTIKRNLQLKLSGYSVITIFCLCRYCIVKSSSLPHDEQSPNHEKKDDLNDINHHSAKRGGENVVFSSEEGTLGALFWEFSGVLDNLPKASSFINNVSIHAKR